MATTPKEVENAVGLEEIHTERQEPPKGQKTFTVEEAVETIGFGRFHILLFLIMGSTGVAEAMEIMLIAVVSPFIRCEWQLQDWQVALVTTVSGLYSLHAGHLLHGHCPGLSHGLCEVHFPVDQINS
ncbi:putative transporter SVOPL [Apus apus]|uniref:putative transporter SVOPL n=1 Tax=Apus apus TaxID=8895 RepID=UPI0021F8FBD9|nr:putative transporter SVOPL [Apus apus]